VVLVGDVQPATHKEVNTTNATIATTFLATTP